MHIERERERDHVYSFLGTGNHLVAALPARLSGRVARTRTRGAATHCHERLAEHR